MDKAQDKPTSAKKRILEPQVEGHSQGMFGTTTVPMGGLCLLCQDYRRTQGTLETFCHGTKRVEGCSAGGLSPLCNLQIIGQQDSITQETPFQG